MLYYHMLTGSVSMRTYLREPRTRLYQCSQPPGGPRCSCYLRKQVIEGFARMDARVLLGPPVISKGEGETQVLMSECRTGARGGGTAPGERDGKEQTGEEEQREAEIMDFIRSGRRSVSADGPCSRLPTAGRRARRLFSLLPRDPPTTPLRTDRPQSASTPPHPLTTPSVGCSSSAPRTWNQSAISSSQSAPNKQYRSAPGL